jgi:tRNA A-37 threonylcarbamoyl transferase component Bud32
MPADPRPEDSVPAAPQGTQTPAEDLQIGQIAVKRGILRPEQLEAGIREQAEALRRGEVSQLCNILVRQGTLTTDDLVRLVREQSQRAEGLPSIPRYDVQAKLGEGATAVVYRAWDRELRRTVALKILRESAGFSDIGRQRFRREAQAAAGLAHPNVITVHDAGEADGRLYLVMELVDGKPLSDLFRDPALPLRQRVDLVERAARGVAAAHDKGIVHRDLKPQNILVAGAEPKVADFGLAHMTDSTTALTRTGSTLGTPLYMSPEQAAGKAREITPRTDVWALGAILYEALAARPPFMGETHLEIYERISHHDPPPMGTAEAFTRDLETVALKALEKDPGKRYPSAREFADDLRRLLDGGPISARRASPLAKAWKRVSRQRAMIAVAALLLASGAWISVLQWRQSSKVRVTLAQASEHEKQGRFQDARDAYRLIRELDGSNPEALAGLQRMEQELERRRRDALEQAKVREEAVKFMKPAVIEGIAGEVMLATEFTRDLAKGGQELLPGNTLETVGRESFARIKYLNVVGMDLDADTLIQQWLEESPSGGQKGVVVKRGGLRVSLPKPPPGSPLVFSTPHVDVQASPSTFRLIVGASSTQLIVERGTLRATRRADGSSTLVGEGTSMECGGKDLMSTRPICAPGGRLVADFDSHVELDWIPARGSNNASIVRSVVHPGLQGSGSLRLEFVVPPNEMVWVTQMYPASQDWSAFSGISFWFNGLQSQGEIILELWENRDLEKRGSEPERFWYKFKDDFLGWKKFDAGWAEFKRRPFPNTPDDGFTRKEMWGVCIIIPGESRERRGVCEIDQLELLPPASQGPGAPWTPIFDGKTLDGFVRQSSPVWIVANGALIWDPASPNREAMQTSKLFDDAEVRIRFDVLHDMNYLYFAIRQDEVGRYLTGWNPQQIRELKGRPHELIFVCRGESVSATLDGQSVPITPSGRPRRGRLQFGGSGEGMRIFSVEYR